MQPGCDNRIAYVRFRRDAVKPSERGGGGNTVKRLLILLVTMIPTLALAQHNQFNPIVDSPVDFAQVSDSHTYVTGNP
jgi:hypothetical protein